MNFYELALARDKTPRKRPDDEEHRIQCACVQWFKMQYPQLEHNLFAVPNGGRRDKVTASKLKSEGVLAGVSDLILLKANQYHHALLIEMKTPTGHQAQTQRRWQRLIEADGYKYIVCRSLEQFITTVNDYLGDAL